MRQQRPSRNGQHGFTLIEVVVAMLVFAIASLGLASLLSGTMVANAKARHRSFATALAQDKIEEIRAGGACSGATASQGSVTFSLVCSTSAGPIGMNNVTVAVTWSDPTSQSVQLQFRM